MSPEPLTPIDNNPPDESSIVHGGNPRHGQGTEEGPHTQTHKESASGPNELRPPPKDPNPTSQKNRRPLKELYQMPPDPTGDHSDVRADHAAQAPGQPPPLPGLHKRCGAQPPGGSHMALHPHPHQNLQPPPLSAPPPSPNGGCKRTWEMSVVASRGMKRRLSRDARRVVMERGSI